ncbi:hypothetical protein IWW54_003349, partial [Coemansia sp. RSA 2705]
STSTFDTARQSMRKEPSPVSSCTFNSTQHSPQSQETRHGPGADRLSECSDADSGVQMPGHASERCLAHPGSRNELWCGDCQAAICAHCINAHGTHTVTPLAVAYDDAYEAVEAMQVAMVRHLTEASKRSAQLKSHDERLDASLDRAQDALDQLLQTTVQQIEDKHKHAKAQVAQQLGGCADWRASLEGTIEAVQQMVEDLPQAQLVAKRDRVLALLGAVERTRPHNWAAEIAADPLEDLVRPAWQLTSLHVPRVAELGRRRGHVRVQSPRFSAHGRVWQAEARRSRGALGEPCLSVVVSCVAESGHAGSAAFAACVLLDDEDQRQFAREAPMGAKAAAAEFSVCSLAELSDADMLDASGGVTLKWGVRAESYAALAQAQQQRIRELEQRVQDLEQRAEEPGAASGPVRRRRGNSDARMRPTPLTPRSPAASSFTFRAEHSPPVLLLQPLSPYRQSPRCKQPMARQPQSPLCEPSLELPQPQSPARLATPLRPRANSSQVAATPLSPLHLLAAKTASSRHRRALSLTAKLRRQPPIPFPLAAGAQSQALGASANGSQVSVAQSQGSAGVFRRLSGWVRSTEDRVALQARRVRRQLSIGSGPSGDDSDALDEWTLLDSSASPGVPHRRSADPSKPRAPPQWPQPPAEPLPPLPDASVADGAEDGFAFDGRADLEREQATVDARRQNEGRLQERCDRILQRVDALQLITNTVENSRDGLTEGTLRRISSELGVLADARRGSRRRPGRRSVTMDSAEIKRAIARTASSQPEPLPPLPAASQSDQRRGLALEQTRARSPPRPHAAGGIGVQLTPQASGRGGILKAGRTRRHTPSGMRVAPPALALGTPSVASSVTGSAQALVTRSGGSRRSPSASSASLAARQIRSARAARKQVRFPEEQRLLESIRLIDPQTARSIETRQMSSESLPSDGSCSLESVGPLPARYARPPIPPIPPAPPVLAEDRDKVVRSKGAVIFDHNALSPTLAAMAQHCGVDARNARGLAVGPNVSSAQSSPVPARVSSKCPSASPSPPSS